MRSPQQYFPQVAAHGLGALAVLSRKNVAITTAHVATGALLLGVAFLMVGIAFTVVGQARRASR